MLHVRVTCPAELTPSILKAFDDDDAVLNLVASLGTVSRPAGDHIMFDVASEAADRVIDTLHGLGVHIAGTIVVTRPAAVFSDTLRITERLLPGDPGEAVVWQEVEDRVHQDSRRTPTYFVLIVLATLIAAVGLLTDSVVLLVGAMVVGPEYSVLAGISMGIQRRDLRQIRTRAATLVLGFAVSIAVTVVFVIVMDRVGWISPNYRHGVHPLTKFVAEPDIYSVIIAALAAVAGTLSLTEFKSGTLVGVLVSVTTIPAAANVAAGLALGQYGEALGAAKQLVLNLLVVALVGAATINVQWRLLRVDSERQHVRLQRRLRSRNGPAYRRDSSSW